MARTTKYITVYPKLHQYPKSSETLFQSVRIKSEPHAPDYVEKELQDSVAQLETRNLEFSINGVDDDYFEVEEHRMDIKTEFENDFPSFGRLEKNEKTRQTITTENFDPPVRIKIENESDAWIPNESQLPYSDYPHQTWGISSENLDSAMQIWIDDHDMKSLLLPLLDSISASVEYGDLAKNILDSQEKETSSATGNSTQVSSTSPPPDQASPAESPDPKSVFGMDVDGENQPEVTNFGNHFHDKDEIPKEEMIPVIDENQSVQKKLTKERLLRYTCNECEKIFPYKSYLARHLLKHFPEAGNVRTYSKRLPSGRPFSCTVCEKIFPSNSALKAHMAVHSEERPYACKICGMRFKSKGNLKVHLMTHNPVNSFACHMCDKIFISKYYLQAHSSIHNGENSLSCKFCGRKFTTKQTVRVHERIHTGEKPYNCTVCDRTFRQVSHLRRHTMTHTGEKPFVCDKCDKSFAAKIDLNTHSRACSQKPYPCQFCVKRFGSKKNVKRHERTHIGKENYSRTVCDGQFGQVAHSEGHLTTQDTEKERFACDKCDETFSSKVLLDSHFRAHSEKPHPCQICGKRFRTKSYVKFHELTHIKEKNYSPMVCDGTFGQVDNLKSHLTIHDTEKKRFACDKCDETFTLRARLNSHLRAHSEKPHPCQICGKRFGSKKNVKIHERTHTGEKNYSRTVCDEKFGQVAHLRTHDTEKKSFACDKCDETFTSRGRLNSHLRAHSEKPYLCQICGKRFRSKPNVKFHERTHFREKKYSPTVCDGTFGHDTEKERFACDKCDEKFLSKALLNSHFWTHSEKPYPCQFCGKRFALKKSVELHERTHAVKKTLTCDKCGKSFVSVSNLKRHFLIHSRGNPLPC